MPTTAPNAPTGTLSPVQALQRLAEKMLAGWNKLGHRQTYNQLFDFDRDDQGNLPPRPIAACALGFIAIADHVDWRDIWENDSIAYYPTWAPRILGYGDLDEYGEREPIQYLGDSDAPDDSASRIRCPEHGNTSPPSAGLGTSYKCYTEASVLELIPHLNDQHRWDAPGISNWLFKLAASDEFKTDTQ